MGTTEIFLGRQPILDRNNRVVAYELLFRLGNTPGIIVTDDMLATASVIHHAFSEMGIQTVLGTHLGFINVSADMLLSEMLELLPKDQVVLELLETIVIDDEVITRCKALKEQGFRLALDDFVFDESYRPLLSVVDIVKIDLTLQSQDKLPDLVNQLKLWPIKLLAEKVDSAEQAAYCHALGFDLFQGYYFARPSVLTAKRAEPSQVALIQILGLVQRDDDTQKIEQVFKQHPNLTYNLMRLVNSVGSGVPQKIATISQAILVLGRAQLTRWLQLLLFTLQSGATHPNPLLLMAATRGKMMELLALRMHNTEYCDAAFMVGILSLIESLINKPLPDIVVELNLDETLAAALLRREGELGLMLQLVECVEQADLVQAEVLLSQMGTLTLSDLTAAEIGAMAWANQVAESVT